MKKRLPLIIIIVIWILVAAFTRMQGSPVNQKMIHGLFDFSTKMFILLPFAFIFVGLFEVWVSRERVERYLGQGTGPLAYLLAIALAGTTVGGLYVAFPITFILYKKGARLPVVLTYLTASGICRIPMTIFEASFMGIKFTLVRFLVSLPLAVLTSWLLGSYLEKREYKLSGPEGFGKKS